MAGMFGGPPAPLSRQGSGAEPTSAPSKRCNCKKARCLKLYCVCFSAGVFCGNCACRDCLNTVETQHVVLEEREKVLQRSPRAFAPKVEEKAGEVVHKKGCRCRKSKCLKKYCECYDAQISCSNSCRCVGCENQPNGGAQPQYSIPHLHPQPSNVPSSLLPPLPSAIPLEPLRLQRLPFQLDASLLAMAAANASAHAPPRESDPRGQAGTPATDGSGSSNLLLAAQAGTLGGFVLPAALAAALSSGVALAGTAGVADAAAELGRGAIADGARRLLVPFGIPGGAVVPMAGMQATLERHGSASLPGAIPSVDPTGQRVSTAPAPPPEPCIKGGTHTLTGTTAFQSPAAAEAAASIAAATGPTTTAPHCTLPLLPPLGSSSGVGPADMAALASSAAAAAASAAKAAAAAALAGVSTALTGDAGPAPNTIAAAEATAAALHLPVQAAGVAHGSDHGVAGSQAPGRQPVVPGLQLTSEYPSGVIPSLLPRHSSGAGLHTGHVAAGGAGGGGANGVADGTRCGAEEDEVMDAAAEQRSNSDPESPEAPPSGHQTEEEQEGLPGLGSQDAVLDVHHADADAVLAAVAKAALAGQQPELQQQQRPEGQQQRPQANNTAGGLAGAAYVADVAVADAAAVQQHAGVLQLHASGQLYTSEGSMGVAAAPPGAGRDAMALAALGLQGPGAEAAGAGGLQDAAAVAAAEPAGPGADGVEGMSGQAFLETLVAAPLMLLEEPGLAEELAGRLGLPAQQQLAARKAAQILKSIIQMGAAAVQFAHDRAAGAGAAPQPTWEAQSHHHLPAQQHQHPHQAYTEQQHPPLQQQPSLRHVPSHSVTPATGYQPPAPAPSAATPHGNGQHLPTWSQGHGPNPHQQQQHQYNPALVSRDPAAPPCPAGANLLPVATAYTAAASEGGAWPAATPTHTAHNTANHPSYHHHQQRSQAHNQLNSVATPHAVPLAAPSTGGDQSAKPAGGIMRLSTGSHRFGGGGGGGVTFAFGGGSVLRPAGRPEASTRTASEALAGPGALPTYGSGTVMGTARSRRPEQQQQQDGGVGGLLGRTLERKLSRRQTEETGDGDLAAAETPAAWAAASRGGSQPGLRRGSRAKRPNSLLADMELNEQAFDSKPGHTVSNSHRTQHAQGQGQEAAPQQQHSFGARRRSAGGPPSPKRCRTQQHGEGSVGGANARGRSSGGGGWAGGEDVDQDTAHSEELSSGPASNGPLLSNLHAGAGGGTRHRILSPFSAAAQQLAGSPGCEVDASASIFLSGGGKGKGLGRKTVGGLCVSGRGAGALFGETGLEVGGLDGDLDDGTIELVAMQALYDLKAAALGAGDGAGVAGRTMG